MQIQPKIPAFAEVSHILLESESTVDPAEAHGILCGLICVEQGMDGKFWFNAILKLLEAREQFAMDRAMIMNLYSVTCQQLSGMTQEFQLVLPDEKASFTQRAIALSRWCKGFIYGLGLTNKSLLHCFSEEAGELLHCINEISKLDFEQIEVEEQDKEAYKTVAEFVRSAVIAIYFECITQIMDSGKGTAEKESMAISSLH